MTDFQSPGSSVSSKRKGLVATPVVTPGRAAFLGLAEKGPIGKATLITLGEYQEVFGDPVATGYLAEAVAQFFDEGGSECYVVRTEHYVAGVLQATTATRALNSGATLALTINASSQGSWANGYRITTTRDNTQVSLCAVNPAATTNQLIMASVARVRLGDVVSVTKGADTQRGRVTGISTVTNTVTLAANITIPVGGYEVTDSVILETLTVRVYDIEGTLVEVYRNLRMHASAGSTYINTVINNASRASIAADSEDLVVSGSVDARPTDVTAVLLAGGTDATASITDADYVGSSTYGNGLYAFDSVDDFLLGPMVPGVCTTAVQQGIIAYVEARQDVFSILEVPQGYTPTQANAYVTSTANLASSYAAIYYPWIKTLDQSNGGLVSNPPCGMLAGMYARTFKRRNFGKAPAGTIDGRLTKALELDYDVRTAEYNILYPNKINAIQKKKKNGIVAFGSRTLDPTGEFGQISIQILFLVVARVFREGTEWVTFEDNTPDTRAQVTRFMKTYLRGLRQDKILAGNKDEDAFFVICDATNNTPSVRRSGKLVCRVGLAKDSPIEFTDITLEQDTRALDAELATAG